MEVAGGGTLLPPLQATTMPPFLHNTEEAYSLLNQQPRVRFSAFQRIFILMLVRFVDGTAKNSRHKLDNYNPTYLVLASGKLVLQKNSYWPIL